MKKYINIIILAIIILLYILSKRKNVVVVAPESIPKGLVATINKIKKDFGYYVEKYADRFVMNPKIIYGIIMTESSGNPNALGGAKERGLMQIMRPALIDANKYGNTNYTYDEMFEPQKNIFIGTAYLAWLYFTQTNKDIKKAIQSYNGGWGNVRKNPNQSIGYYNKVMKYSKYF